MLRSRTAILLGVVLAVLPTAWAQYTSEVVGFNGDPNAGQPIDDPATSQEMFRIPQWSGSTSRYVIANSSGAYDYNAAFRASGLQTEGAAALEVYFNWDPNVPDPEAAWVRLTTFDGPTRPNPGLHLQGKVRFRITNRSEFFQGAVGLCIGVRETGADVPLMANGGKTGDIEWVGVSTKRNGITAGADRIVQTTASGDDVQVFPVGYDFNVSNPTADPGVAVIGPGPNGRIDTTPAGDDAYRAGFDVDPNVNVRRPIPAIVITPSGTPWNVEFDLATGRVRAKNTSTPNDYGTYDPNDPGTWAGFTGDGVLSAPNNRGALEHIAFTKVATDYAQLIDVGIDEMQFEAPVPDPVVRPRVLAPIIANDTQVVVADLMYWVREVRLFVNGSPAGTWTNPDPNSTDPLYHPAQVAISISPAVAGDVYTARQVSHQTGAVSEESLPVTVLSGPPPYTFSLLVDETGGGSCTTTSWEWVGVTAASGWVPQGQAIVPNSAMWQVVEVPLNDDNLVLSSPLSGNGALDDSPTGYYTIDSVWFTIGPGVDPGNLGPHEVFIDAVQTIDPNGAVSATILDMEDGVNRLQYPRGQSPVQSVTSSLSSTTSYDGLYSHRLLWSYADNSPTWSLGMLQRLGYQCGTSQLIDDDSIAIRFHMLCRAPRIEPNIPLPTVVGPIIRGNQTAVRVNKAAAATMVQLFIDGVAVGSVADPNGAAYVDFTGLTMSPGQSISARQTVPEGVSDYAYPRVVAAAPPPPSVQPVLPGAATVSVTNCLTVPYATASQVNVYIRDPNGALWATGSAAGGTATVVVPVSPAPRSFDAVTATQTVNGATSVESAPVYVMVPAPVIYKAPAEGDTSIRVQNLLSNATLVTITKNGTTTFTAVPTPGVRYVDVPVSGLVMGDTVTAKQAVGVVDGAESVPETVTTNTTTSVFCDSFEYDEATYQSIWATSANPRPTLDTAQNSTPGGGQSVFVPAGTTGSTGAGRIHRALANFSPSATNPVVWNVNIYDRYGPGASNVQFAQLNGQTADFWYQHVGMLSWSPQDTNYYQYRAVGNGGPNWIDLTELDAPVRSVGWHNFTIVHKGMRIDVYVDGLLAKKNLTLTDPTTYDMARIGPGYTSDGSAWYDDYCVEIGPVRFNLLPPTVNSPVEAGDTTVRVSSVQPTATSVTVYANGTPIGSTSPGGNAVVDVPVTPLVAHDLITASQSLGGPDSILSQPLEVGQGNGPLFVCIGIRETNDTGPLGTPGGTTGQIEWVGASAIVNGAPIGLAVPLQAGWQTLTFNPLDPNGIKAMPGGGGDNVITATRGVLEHLAVTVDPNSADRSSGRYVIFVDDVVNVGAGAGGSDFVIADFESFNVGDEVLFQEPTYSGTTVGNLSYPPSASACTDAQAASGTKSELLTWFFRDTQSRRWARITTAGTPNLRQPIIDLTKPIRLKVLVMPTAGACCLAGGVCEVLSAYDCVLAGGEYQGDFVSCTPNPCVGAVTGACCQMTGECSVTTEAECTGTWLGEGTDCDPNPCLCAGDTNCDGEVTFADIDGFVEALSGEENWTHWPCPWLNADCNGDGDVTFADLDPFVSLIGTTCP